MTDKKITELDELTYANLADTDVLAVVDISDTTMDASGTTKKIRALPDRLRAISYGAGPGTETFTPGTKGEASIVAVRIDTVSFPSSTALAQLGNFAYGAEIRGFAGGDGTLYADGKGPTAIGFPDAGATISCDANGGYARGCASDGAILVTSDGGTAFGYVQEGTISATDYGAMAHGASFGVYGLLTATAIGANAWGYAKDGAITASGLGSFAGGHIVSGGALTSSGLGSFMVGFASGAGSSVTASGSGSFAIGYAISAGTVTASGLGSFAVGYSYGYAMTASGKGSFVGGYGYPADTIASGDGAFQWGPGTNALANSLAVGANMRISGALSAPGTPRNGDIYTDGTDVFIRTGGAWKNASNI